MAKTTLAEIWWQLLKCPTVKSNHCIVCGKSGHLEQHHLVKRSAGEYFDDCGRKVKKPTVSLCGFGNSSGCHGKAHANQLHFRWVPTFGSRDRDLLPIYGGHLEVLETDTPVKYQDALTMDGWRRV